MLPSLKQQRSDCVPEPNCPVKRHLGLIKEGVELGMVLACGDKMAKGIIGMNVKCAGNCDCGITTHQSSMVLCKIMCFFGVTSWLCKYLQEWRSGLSLV